jgi:hypothetical protein
MDFRQQKTRDIPAEEAGASQSGRRATIRSHLRRLVLVCVLPVWLISGFLVYYAYDSKRAQETGHMLGTARALSMSVDRELASIQAALQALATSPVFGSGDLAGIHSQALELLRSYPKADIIVADADGQQLVNSYRPFGSPLPKRNTLETVHRIFQTEKPVVSDLFFGAVTKRPLIAIDVPVFRRGKVVYDLSMTLPSDRLAAILSHQHLPPEWYGSILDSKGVVVARTRRPQLFVGRRAGPVIRQAIARSAEDIIKVTNLEDTSVIDAFSRSTASNWTVVIGIPTSIAMTHMYAWLGWAIGCATILSLFGIALAMRIGGRIDQSIQSLVAPAMALGSGELVSRLSPHSVRETECVAEALFQASQLLEQRAAERNRAEEEIRSLNQELEHRVQERTEELEKKNGELERMNKVFVGRELRMIELKKRISELEERAA